MREYLTEAIVLGRKPSRESDLMVNFYTKDLGRIEARVIGGRKIISKLSPQFSVGNMVILRLVEKNQFTVADALIKKRFIYSKKNLSFHSAVLDLIFLVRSLSPLSLPDLELWHYLLRSLEGGKRNSESFLKIFGFDPISASCETCSKKRINYFNLEGYFLCLNCSLKFSQNKLILVN